MILNKNIKLIVCGIIISSLVGAALAFAEEPLKSSFDVVSIDNWVNGVETRYQSMGMKDVRKDVVGLMEAFTAFCQGLKIDCKAEISLVKSGNIGATKEALIEIIQNGWVNIKKKSTGQTIDLKPGYFKAIKQTIRQVNYLGVMTPENLVNLYKGSDFKQTVKDTTENLGKMVVVGKISEAQVEGIFHEVFDAAQIDTSIFAKGLLDKYNLTNVAVAVLKDPKNIDAIKQEIGKEIQSYAEQEMNKLANQAIGSMFPILQGVQFDFTEMNSKTFKSTLRSTIVNAMAQSYLGPEYVAVYMAVSTVCPSCMEKTHAELRRFDKKYLQPGTEKIGEEWGRFEDRVKAESKRVGKQIESELKRLLDRYVSEYARETKQMEEIAKKTYELYRGELKKAQDSRVGKEVERQLTDIYNESSRGIDKVSAELRREYEDVLKEEERLGKRAIAEYVRETKDGIAELKRFAVKYKDEMKREIKTVTNAAQSSKEKVEAELKRAADRVKAEAARAQAKVKAEANRIKNQAKKLKKKLKF